MKKLLSSFTDISVTVGCSLGVGLLSGKESQIFANNTLSVIVFAAVFCLANVSFRLFCGRTNSASLAELSRRCFGKYHNLLNVGLLVCCFVTLTAILAGVEQCVGMLLPVSAFPFYAILTATIAAVILVKGMGALKAVNVVALILSVALLIIILTKRNVPNTLVNVPVYMPVAYAMFSVTMSLGVTCKLACECTPRQNVVRSVISAAVLFSVLLAVLNSCDFTLTLPALGQLTGAEKWFAAITLVLAASTGLVANAYPVLEGISDAIEDKTLASAAIFSFALALSFFGFDFALKFGYAAVSIVGIALLAAIAVRKRNTLSKDRF